MSLMNINRKKIFVLVFAVFFAAASCFGLGVPELTGRVNDNAKLMSSKEKQEAEEYLASVEQKNGIQIFVLTVKSLQGENLEEYANRVFEKWGIGQKKEDNGVLLLVAYNERDVRIEVGYGLEGTLTDTKCGLILRNVIIPEFRNGDYGKGICKGVKAVGGIVAGDVEVEEQLKASDQENVADGLFAAIIILVWFIIVFASILSRYGIWGLLVWNMMGRRGPKPKRKPYVPNPHVTIHTTGFGGGFGGGGFGGFGGGGGGHSGGGGASGHW